MRLSAPLLTLAGTVGGTIAAVAAYQSAASVGSAPAEPASVTTPNPAPVTTTDWLPCKKGWKLKGETCVRVQEKVVVVRDLPAPAAPQARVATAPVRSGAASGPVRSGRDHAEDRDHADDRDEAEDRDHEDEAEHESEHEDDHEVEVEHEDVGDDD